MFLGSFLIGLREGLEAALIVGILVAFVKRQQRSDVLRLIFWAVISAVALSVGLGALFTFGRYGLSFQAQEIIGGGMSLLAVVMITWMVFWMANLGGQLKDSLEKGAAQALTIGSGWAIFWLAFVSVGREGLETTLLLWGWALQPRALVGALVGILVAVAMGVAINRGILRISFRKFFAWTGGALVVVAGGILAYGIHDLQEAGVLPGPFSGAPITPVDFRTGEVLVGFFTDRPYWGAPFPFGWAFNVQDTIDPAGPLAAFLQGTVGFMPQMSWLQVIAWVAYLVIALPMFLRRILRQSPAPVPATARAVTTVTTPAPDNTTPKVTPTTLESVVPEATPDAASATGDCPAAAVVVPQKPLSEPKPTTARKDTQ